VALSKVSSGGRAVGTHRGVHRRQRINWIMLFVYLCHTPDK
jgi:hypothetical protein